MSSKSLAELPDISSIPEDLVTPTVTGDAPEAGKRVRQTTRGWEGTDVHHALYLPTNWVRGRTFPVVVEYAGNHYTNALGDACGGTVEGCNLGYGLSGGNDYIWVCLPFVQVSEAGKENARTWWGDPDETIRYCLATLKDVGERFGGDERKTILCGFSRGSIACNYIGLRDDAIAGRWAGFLCHSHYDGVRPWPHADSDAASARQRLGRLNGRPQFISMEGSTAETRKFLADAEIRAPFTFVDLPFRNHTDCWVLRDCAARRQAREWLRSEAGPSAYST